MTMTLIFLCLVLTAVLAGVREGMIMIRSSDVLSVSTEDGVRGHFWFKAYHLIRSAVVIGYGIIGWYLISQFVTTWEYLVTLCLAAVIANDLFEYGYSYARFKTLINIYPESFNIADVIKFHASSVTLHIIRLALIIACIIILIVL